MQLLVSLIIKITCACRLAKHREKHPSLNARVNVLSYLDMIEHMHTVKKNTSLTTENRLKCVKVQLGLYNVIIAVFLS